MGVENKSVFEFAKRTFISLVAFIFVVTPHSALKTLLAFTSLSPFLIYLIENSSLFITKVVPSFISSSNLSCVHLNLALILTMFEFVLFTILKSSINSILLNFVGLITPLKVLKYMEFGGNCKVLFTFTS
ncbi:hypothetical protein VN0966_06510 [Helicobacter pylori]